MPQRAIYGHAGSVREPYETLRLYQSASIAVPGAHQANFAPRKNAEYDKLVDEAYGTDPNDTKKLSAIWRRAMEIWLPELPDIELVQNYHRIPWNTTYWKNWPTEENAYVNGAHWHLTFAMVLWNLAAGLSSWPRARSLYITGKSARALSGRAA